MPRLSNVQKLHNLAAREMDRKQLHQPATCIPRVGDNGLARVRHSSSLLIRMAQQQVRDKGTQRISRSFCGPMANHLLWSHRSTCIFHHGRSDWQMFSAAEELVPCQRYHLRSAPKRGCQSGDKYKVAKGVHSNQSRIKRTCLTPVRPAGIHKENNHGIPSNCTRMDLFTQRTVLTYRCQP